MIAARLADRGQRLALRLAKKAERLAIARAENAVRSRANDGSRWRQSRLLWPLFTTMIEEER